MSDDENVGDVVRETPRHGVYEYVGVDGSVWYLQYVGGIQLL